MCKSTEREAYIKRKQERSDGCVYADRHSNVEANSETIFTKNIPELSFLTMPTSFWPPRDF